MKSEQGESERGTSFSLAIFTQALWGELVSSSGRFLRQAGQKMGWRATSDMKTIGVEAPRSADVIPPRAKGGGKPEIVLN